MSLTVGILKKCIEESKKSSYKFKIGAVIFKGNRILSYAHNAIRSCSKIPVYLREWENSLHAEARAILKVKNKETLKGASILVMKVSKTEGIISNAMPCSFCHNMLKLYGIKNIYYSNESGNIASYSL